MDDKALGYSIISQKDMDDEGALKLAAAIVEKAKKDYALGKNGYWRGGDRPEVILNWTQSRAGSLFCLCQAKEKIKTDWDKLASHLEWRRKLKCRSCDYGKKKICQHRMATSYYHNPKCLMGEERREMELELENWLDMQAEAYKKSDFNDEMMVVNDGLGIRVVGVEKMAEAAIKKLHDDAGMKYFQYKGVKFYEVF